MNRTVPPCRVGLVYGPVLDVGGVEKHLLQVLEYLDREKFEPIVFSSASDSFVRQVRAFGSQTISWEIRHAFDFRAATRLKKLLQEHHIDMVHVHHPRAYWSASRAAHTLDIPCIATVHMPAWEMAAAPVVKLFPKKWMYAKGEGWLLQQRMDRVIFVSENARLRSLPIANAVTIPNGIKWRSDLPAETREVIREGLHASNECVVLIVVGRLHHQKGYDVLLDALAMVKPMPVCLELWIAGTGEEREALEQQTLTLNLQGVVRFLGERSDVPELLQAADIFVLPSRFEGMPYALLEAMAAGMAVISSDAGEAGTLIEDAVNGVLVPVGDVVCLAERIKTLQETPAMRAALGEAARAHSADFEIEPLMKRLASVYTETIQSRLGKDGGG